MKEIYKGHVETANKLSEGEKLSFLTSVLRSLLQTVVVTSFELIRAKTPSDEIDLLEFSNRFRKPVDGLPVEILDNVVPFLREYVAPQLVSGWFEITKSSKTPLSKQLKTWVEFRNKRPGHGVLDDKISSEWAAKTEKIILECLDAFEESTYFTFCKHSFHRLPVRHFKTLCSKPSLNFSIEC